MADLTGSGRDDEQQPLPLPQPPAPAPVIQDPQNANWQAPNATPDQQTYNQVVADSIAQQYTPVVDDPPMPPSPAAPSGGYGVGGPIMPAAAPPPQSGSDFFYGQSGAGWKGYAPFNPDVTLDSSQIIDQRGMAPPSAPQSPFTGVTLEGGGASPRPGTVERGGPPGPSGSSFFAAAPTINDPDNPYRPAGPNYVASAAPSLDVQALYDNMFKQQVGPPPTPGDGSQWFGTPTEQQQQANWWQSEVQKAIDAGDMDKYHALLAERDRVQGLWNQYLGPATSDRMSGVQQGPGTLQEWQQRANQFNQQFPALMQGNAEYGQSLGAIDPETQYLGAVQTDRTAAQSQYQSWLAQQQMGMQNAPYQNALSSMDAEAQQLGQMQGMSLPERSYLAMSDQAAGSDLRGRQFADQMAQQSGDPRMYYNGQLEGSNFYGPAPDSVTSILGEGALGLLHGVGAGLSYIGKAADWATKYQTGGGDTSTSHPVSAGVSILGNDYSKHVTEPAGKALSYLWYAQSYYIPGGQGFKAQQAGESYQDYAARKYEAQGVIARLGVETLADPMNWIVPESGGLVNVDKFSNWRRAQQIGKAIADSALSDADLKIAAATLTSREISTIPAGIDAVIKAGGFRANSDLDMAIASQIAVKGRLARAGGGTLGEGAMDEVLADIPRMAKKLKVSDAEEQRVIDVVTNNRAKIANAADVTPEIIAPRGQPAPSGTVKIGESTPVPPAEKPRLADTTPPYTPFPESSVITTAPVTSERVQRLTKLVGDSVNPAEIIPPPFTPAEIPSVPGNTIPDDLMTTLAQQHANPRVVTWNPFEELNALPPAERTVEAATRISENAPPTLNQYGMAQDRWRLAKQLNDSRSMKAWENIGNDIKSAKVTAKDAYDRMAALLTGNKQTSAIEAAGRLRTLGYDVPFDVADPAFGPRLVAAIEQQQAKQMLGRTLADMLPSRWQTPFPTAMRGQYLRFETHMVGDVPVMTPQRLWQFIYTHADELRAQAPSMADFVDNMLEHARFYASVSERTPGKISETSITRPFLKDIQAFQRSLAHGEYPSDDMQALSDLLHSEYFTSPVAEADLQRAAAARLGRLDSTSRDAVLKEIEGRKGAVTQLVAEMKAAQISERSATDLAARTAAQQQVGALGQQIEEHAARIRQYDPTYKVPRPQKVVDIPARDAAQDAVLAQEVTDGDVTFTTSKGSTYEVHADGTTTRNKSFHPEHGPEDQGIQPRSQQTFYVTEDGARQLGEIQTRGAGKRVIDVRGDQAGVRYADGPSAGKIEQRTLTAIQHQPAKGLIPVELWGDGAQVHFGNPIDDVTQATGAAALPPSSPVEQGITLANAPTDSNRDVLDNVTRAQQQGRTAKVKAGFKPTEMRNAPVTDESVARASHWVAGMSERQIADLKNTLRAPDGSYRAVYPQVLEAKTEQRLNEAGSNAAALAEHFNREARAGLDMAAGGGMGIVHPDTARLINWRRPVRPVIDEYADAWANFEWHNPEKVKALDAALDDVYGVPQEAATLPKDVKYHATLQTQVVKISDLVTNFVRGQMDKALTVRPDDPAGFMRDIFTTLADRSASDTELAKITDFFTTSRHGRETLKELRKYAPDILDQWWAMNPHLSVAHLPLGLITIPADGMMAPKDLTSLSRLLAGTARPKITRTQELGDLQWQFLKDVRGAYGGAADDLDTLAKAGHSIHIDGVDRMVFGDAVHPDTPVDVVRIGDRVASLVAEKKAAEIGFNPDAIPMGLRLMQWQKGNLAPLWMTMMPSYTVNNFFGNLMGQVVALIRSDMHAGGPWLDRSVKAAWEDAGTGWVRHPYMTEGYGSQTAEVNDAVAGSIARDKHFVPKVIHSRAANPLDLVGLRLGKGTLNNEQGYQLGIGGIHDALLNLNGGIERHFKEAIYSHQAGWSYIHNWEPKIRNLPLDQAVKDELVQATGVNQVQSILENHGVDAETRTQILGMHSGAVDAANAEGYRVTAEVMRDYRMRNQFDAWMDHVFPIHYWTTKNFLFVGRTLADRPGLAVLGMKGYDAWKETNKDLPYSMRTGYLPLTNTIADAMGLDHDAWYMKLEQQTNPALLVIPRLIDDVGHDWSSSEGSSLPMRLRAAATGGMQSLMSNAGMSPAPFYQAMAQGLSAALRAKGMSDQSAIGKGKWWEVDPMSVLNGITMPVGYHNDLIPFLDQANRSGLYRDYVAQHWHTLVYGTPYTRGEVYGFYGELVRREHAGEISDDQRQLIERQLAAGNWSDPQVKALVDDVMGDRANKYLITKTGWTGRKIEQYTKDMRAAQATFNTIVASNGQTEAMLGIQANRKLLLGVEPFFRDYLDQQVAQGTMTADQQHEVLQDVLVRGNLENEWFSKAVDTANRRLAQGDVVGGDADALRGMSVAQATFNKIAEKKGMAAAYLWMEQNAPELTGWWHANDDPSKVQAYYARQDQYGAQDKAYQAADEYYDKLNENRNNWAPYYARIDRITVAADRARVNAKGDPYRLAVADKIEKEGIATVYDDAKSHGLELIRNENRPMPLHGDPYYDTTRGAFGDRAMRAMPVGDQQATVNYERSQKQRGYLLDLVAAQLGMDRKDPKFQSEAPSGKTYFDQSKWDTALADAAKDAPTVYAALVAEFMVIPAVYKYTVKPFQEKNGPHARTPLDGGLHLDTLTSSITPDDFKYHLANKYPNWTAMSQAVYDYSAIPKGTPERQAAYKALIDKYGADVFNTVYGTQGAAAGLPDGSAEQAASQNANQTYSDGTQAVKDLYNSLSPREKADFTKKYGDSFMDTVHGEHGDYLDVTPHKLTTETMNQILSDYHITPSGMPAGREGLGRDSNVVVDRVSAAEKQQITDLTNQYYDVVPDGMTKEDVDFRMKAYTDYKTTAGAQPYANGQTLEEAAQALYQSPESKAKSGFQSWRKAAAVAGEDTPLGQYIMHRIDLSGDTKDVYDARDAWFKNLPEAQQQLLIRESPKVFGDFANTDSGTSSTASSGTTSTAATGSTKSNSSTFVPYPKSTKSSSTYTPYTPVSGSTYFSNTGTSSSSASGPYLAHPSAVNQAVTLLDPMLVAGQDDGRAAIASQIADRFISLTAFQDKKMANMMLAGLLHWLMKKLGANPTLESWQSVLALLQSHQGQGGGGQQPQQRPMQDSAQPAIQPNMGGGEAFALAQRTNLPPTQSLGY